MGELKPIGSEKLNGDDKLKRILELTYYKTTDEKSKSSEVIKESTSGVYGIVKEKDGYYVKRGLNENSLDYIGGLYMKNKNRFSSYGEALKKLEFLTEQENLQEATKYVLKRPKPATPPAPQAEAPAPMPTNEPAAPPAAPDPSAMDSGDSGELPPPPDGGEDMGGEKGAPEDPVKIIQTKTGKLTQKLNQFKDDLESEDIKYVLNMILGAVDLDKMDEEDKDAILSKLEGDEEGEEGMGNEEGGEEEIPPMNDMAKQTAEDSGGMGSSQVGGIGDGETDDENGGIDPMDSLEELINSPFEDDDFIPYNDEDDEDIYDLGPEDYKASRAAQHDIAKEREGMDDDPVDDEVEYGEKDAEDDEDEVDEMMSATPGGEEMAENMPAEDQVKELDIDELNNMVSSSVKETLSKYFSE